jgi:phosphatidylinositol phospholipase C delta
MYFLDLILDHTKNLAAKKRSMNNITQMDQIYEESSEASTSFRNHKLTVANGFSTMNDFYTNFPSIVLHPHALSRTIEELKQGEIYRSKVYMKEKNAKRHVFKLDYDESYLEIYKRVKHQKIATIFLADVTSISERTMFSGRSKVRRIFLLGKKLSNINYSLTIKYGSINKQKLCVECKDLDEYNNLVGTLCYLVKEAKEAFESNPTKYMVMKSWWIADRNGDGKVDPKELTILAERLNIMAPRELLMQKFREVDTDNDGYLQYPEFVELCKMLLRRTELDPLFNRYSSVSQELMYAGDFLNFLQRQQQETETTLADATNIMAKNGAITTTYGLAFTKHDFSRYLFSTSNTLEHPDIYLEYEDMDQPLTHYFINSSHNTYLTGNQLRSESSVDMYRQVLATGCRCIELDCWDGKNGEPIITHGHTLTSRIQFRDVCECINTYAFEKSEYPIILSLEVHCGVEQQERMADHLVAAFGKKLLLPTEVEHLDVFPSPSQLKHRILLKGKRVRGNTDQYVEEEEEVFEKEHPVAAQAEKVLPPEAEVAASTIKKPKQKVSKVLSDLIALSAVTFKPPLTQGPVYEMHSFSETKIAKFLALDYISFAQWNKRQFSRIYPKGTRFISSNYDPTHSWNAGCQMVALNFQKRGMLII